MARPDAHTDEATVQQAFRAFWEQGSASALEGLLRALADRAYAQAWHVLSDGAAHHALQEAQLQLVRKRADSDGSVPFQSILFHLAYRSAQMGGDGAHPDRRSRPATVAPCAIPRSDGSCSTRSRT